MAIKVNLLQSLQEECAITTDKAETERQKLSVELHRLTSTVQSFYQKIQSVVPIVPNEMSPPNAVKMS